MGAFSDIFGKVPKVLILEMFAENPNDELTIRDIIDQTEVSKRGAYLIVKKFEKTGILIELPGKPKKYILNHNDLRAKTLINAEPLLILGKLEYELKLDDNIALSKPFTIIEDNYTESYIEEALELVQSDIQIGDLYKSSKQTESRSEPLPIPVGA
jgi:hypothetical protein